jgi:hypothetical protein
MVGRGVGDGKRVGVGGGPWVFVGAAVGRGRGRGIGKFWQAEMISTKPSQTDLFTKFIQTL